MTDPVLDRAGKTYHFGYGSLSTKTGNPAIGTDDIGEIDLVLLSHHQHQDNFDRAGMAFAKSVPLILSTTNAAKKISNAVGLKPWDSHKIITDKVPGLKVTATPCRHHPWWLPKFFSGDVIGFIIEFEGQEDGVIYISGDTVLYSKLDQIASEFTVDKMIVHLGSVQFRYLTGFGKYTMDAHDGVKLTERINPRQVIPIHTHGWTHFKEPSDNAKQTFLNSSIADKTLWVESGRRYNL